MPQSFEYVPFNGAPYAASVAELLARAGDPAARAAIATAQANGRAREISGQAYAGAAQNIGNTIANSVQVATDPRRKMDALKLADEQQYRAGQQKVASLMQGDQLHAGDAGPRQESYLDHQGLFDVPKLSEALASSGYGHLAPELLKGAESINDSITRHQQTEAQLSKEHAIMLGDLAHSAIELHKSVGMPLDGAMDFVVRPALATKRIQPQEYQQVRDQIAGLPPDQQIAALGTFRDQAAKLSPTKNLSEGAQETDRYGRVVASGAPKPPTEAELARLAAGGDKTAAAALALLKPGPKATDQEMELDAYAQSIGKKTRTDLSYAERQTFDKNKAQIHADAGFQQHMRERLYDNAHPTPVKDADQGKLEQQYRTVLTRAMSSRSGGIGSEDAKVLQANHLLALIHQTYDAQKDSYNIPKTLQGELAAGLARLVAPGGNVGIEMMREFDQKTAKGDFAGALSYITGHPFPTSSQDFAKLLKDSIERQGDVAQENREAEMRYLRGLAPTELEESRRTALEANNLAPLRQSRVIRNTASGERKLQVSTDGGKTWK